MKQELINPKYSHIIITNSIGAPSAFSHLNYFVKNYSYQDYFLITDLKMSAIEIYELLLEIFDYENPFKTNTIEIQGKGLYRKHPPKYINDISERLIITPNYNLFDISHFIDSVIPLQNKLGNKKQILDILPDKVKIPEPKIGEKYIMKPIDGSGSKGILIKDSFDGNIDNNYVYQKYIDSEYEVILDVLLLEDHIIYFTARKSYERINGFDSIVGFDFSDEDIEYYKSLIMILIQSLTINKLSYDGFLNIQLRNNLIQEIDFRISGSSLCNLATEYLLNIYYTFPSKFYLSGKNTIPYSQDKYPTYINMIRYIKPEYKPENKVYYGGIYERMFPKLEGNSINRW